MIGRVQGKIAVVTGASNGTTFSVTAVFFFGWISLMILGIGREISLLLAREGATVVCSDISPSARASDFKSTHDEITSSGGKAIFHKADVTSESDVEALIGKAVSEYGRVDIVVNNAGIAVRSPSLPILPMVRC
jgi:NAD(P)-dependent dehydrogenase (short-subunit alcohol dehydrogenase family)